MLQILDFYGDLTPRQSKGLIIGLLGLCLGATAIIAAAGNEAMGLGAGIGVMTAVYCVIKEA